jgi:hypothetical protein
LDEFNPYAPPKAKDIVEPYPPSGDRVWRDGPLLVMTKGAQLPDRCLKCNLPAGGWRLKRKLSWHHSAWYLLILLNLLIYAIAALIVRHTATVMIPLCEKHRRRRRWAIGMGWLLVITGIVLIAAGGSNEGYEAAILIGLLLFLAGLIFGIAGSQVAVPTRIDGRFVWIKNVNPEFLNELPAVTF